MILMVLMWVLNFDNLIGVIGTGAIIALLVFIILTFVAGYVLGGPAKDTKPVMGLGRAQRNVSAANWANE
jgi:BASS family bile acid:Na+ symporter